MNSEIIFIIGAGRSGTNILRDTISSLPGINTWPCDEINLIMRHGNTKKLHDEFGPQDANSRAKKFIQKEFKRLLKNSQSKIILEKTCANSLRVSFLNEIFPHSKFIFITRNGFDVVTSAKKRWTSSIEIKYLLKKVKYVPFSDVPHYLLNFIINRTKQFFSKDKQMPIWGPIYNGMQQDVKQLSLDEVCAIQWAKCVNKAHKDLKNISSSRVKHITYENFVENPMIVVEDINLWLGYNWTKSQITSAIKKVRKHKKVKGINSNELEHLEKLKNIIHPVMINIHSKVN